MKTLTGTVNGRTIELSEDSGIADGERVEVTLKPHGKGYVWGDGIRRSAGAAAGIIEFDEVFESVREARKSAEIRDVNP